MAAAAPYHYPYVTRMLLDLFEDGQLTEVASVQVEPEYGYAVRIAYKNGAVRLTRGNDVGLNSGAACDVVKDKEYTKFFLKQGGYVCPRGRSFLLPWWAERLRPSLRARGLLEVRDSTNAVRYVREQLGFPVYVKPTDGSKGYGVWRCDSEREIEAVLGEYSSQKVRVAVVEEAVTFPDYRLVIVRGQLISAYLRTPLSIVGDGVKSIVDLISELQDVFEQAGRDTRIDKNDKRIALRLRRERLDLSTVPRANQVVQLLDISNLSTGGTALDVTEDVAPRWRQLSADIAKHLGLHFCGVDLACPDVTTDAGDYYILEVNASPGLDHYASIGSRQEKMVRNLYATVLNVAPQSNKQQEESLQNTNIPGLHAPTISHIYS